MDRDVLTAIITVVVAIVVAQLIDRALAKRGKRITDGLSPVANTRLRMVRRLIFAAILLIGVMLALSQFEGITRIATGILASSAVLGIVVGFASQRTLGNFVAGLMIGRTPEYLGKKVGPTQIKLASLYILVTPVLVLAGAAATGAALGMDDDDVVIGVLGPAATAVTTTRRAPRDGSSTPRPPEDQGERGGPPRSRRGCSARRRGGRGIPSQASRCGSTSAAIASAARSVRGGR